ncbi:MAG: hypothetical protein GTN69_07285 [Armatimonadetes bacterium]|nr:hypothetical protein [Armatimonadota bacterium]NIO75674.1 hypothetical protein [Armatimonadota bacterium]NIO98668.1 hypothetical protein [Armatimonadota bacterium]
MRKPEKKKDTSMTPSRTESAHKWKTLLHLILFSVAAIAAASYVYLQSPHIIARDALYHLRHAAVYASEGLFMTEFPWVVYSVVSTFAADIWYGFHVLLIPFTSFNGPVAQVKTAGIFILATMLVLFYLAMRRNRMALPFLWPFVLLFISGSFVGRLTTTRPVAISMGLTALLFSFMISGGILAVFFLSLALTFFHLSFFWLGILIAIAVSAVKVRTERKWEWRKPLAVLLGLAAGWLLRPNPIGAAKVLYVQVFRLMFEKQKGLLAFGRELYPMRPEVLLHDYGLLILIWLGITAISLFAIIRHGVERPARNRTLLWSSLGLSLLFFAMTPLLSQRSVDQWALFAIIFVAAGFTYFIVPRQVETKAFSGKKFVPRQTLGGEMRAACISAGALILAFMMWRATDTQMLKKGYGIPPDRLKGGLEWLKDNSEPGEIVFHVSWGNFPELFYWNQHNRYIGGMDPIFQYAYDKSLYWKVHHLWVGKAPGYTWGSPKPEGAKLEDAYTVMTRDFKASYLLLEELRSPTLFSYVTSDPRFVPRFDDGWTAIFRLSDDGQTEQIGVADG